MPKLVYPNPLRHYVPGSRRWAYTFDGLHVVTRCRSGEIPACYVRKALPVGVFGAFGGDKRAAKRSKSENGISRR